MFRGPSLLSGATFEKRSDSCVSKRTSSDQVVPFWARDRHIISINATALRRIANSLSKVRDVLVNGLCFLH